LVEEEELGESKRVLVHDSLRKGFKFSFLGVSLLNYGSRWKAAGEKIPLNLGQSLSGVSEKMLTNPKTRLLFCRVSKHPPVGPTSVTVSNNAICWILPKEIIVPNRRVQHLSPQILAPSVRRQIKQALQNWIWVRWDQYSSLQFDIQISYP
jgi:hypothetical protein